MSGRTALVVTNINTINIKNTFRSGQLQSYCDLICRHELYVEYRTSIITHHQFFFYLNKVIFVHNLFGLIHRTSVASHLFVCEGIHLDETQLIVYDRIEMMLILDQQTLNKQLLPKYLPLTL
ncbi:unnamed protein product [Rotaria sp. Silwood2]|nr:unnamed protein product [Rotaria sp. Silwood2]